MSIVQEYARQYQWRAWPQLLDLLPKVDGKRILDLGCGIGDIAADFSARGANVVGIDGNAELISYAKKRNIQGAEFLVDDLNTYCDSDEIFDGIWASFTAAYFPNLPQAIRCWQTNLRPGGWIALTEIDDFFAHQPVSSKTKAFLSRYVEDALEASRYDFRMGRKLAKHLTQEKFTVVKSTTCLDAEFSFAGVARPDVVDAWRIRFDRMFLLQEFCGNEFSNIRDDFLDCLQHEHHTTESTVCFCLANKPRT